MVNVTTIGGGTGTYHVLGGLKKLENVNINAIVAMSDDGGSTGRLRDEYGVLPSGDIRRAILALANENNFGVLRDVFTFRFDKGSFKGHNLGNLIMMALEQIGGDFSKGIHLLEDMFDIKGKVYPVTLEKTKLLLKLTNGEYVLGEKNIDSGDYDRTQNVEEFYVIRQEYGDVLEKMFEYNISGEELEILMKTIKRDRPTENKKLETVLMESDYILICPGTLYGSIMPNLMVGDTLEYIKKSKAKKILISNLFNQYGDTTGFKISDFIDIYKKYLGEDIFDYILVQDWEKYPLDTYSQERYQKDKKQPVVIDLDDKRIIKCNFMKHFGMVRHDSDKITDILSEIIK